MCDRKYLDFIENINCGILNIDNVHYSQAKGIFGAIAKNPKIKIVSVNCTNLNGNIRITTFNYKSKYVKANINFVKIKYDENIFEFLLDLDVLFLFIKAKITTVDRTKAEQLAKILRKNLRGLTLDLNSHNLNKIYWRQINLALADSKSLRAVDFRYTDVSHIIGHVIKHNKCLFYISYTSQNETREVIQDKIEESLKFNSTLLSIESQDNMKIQIKNKLYYNRCILPKLIKFYMLMMRNRPGCIVSLLPRRLLIYLLDFITVYNS